MFLSYFTILQIAKGPISWNSVSLGLLLTIWKYLPVVKVQYYTMFFLFLSSKLLAVIVNDLFYGHDF